MTSFRENKHHKDTIKVTADFDGDAVYKAAIVSVIRLKNRWVHFLLTRNIRKKIRWNWYMEQQIS